jgi:hypothetical protein
MANYRITMVSEAIQMGAEAFAGKLDKTGFEPAFFHSMRVAATVKKAGGGEVAEAAAFLHDVIEDTHFTEQDIRNRFANFEAEKVEELITTILSVTRGYIKRDSRVMVFSPPASGLVCDCEFRKCTKSDHIYDKETYRAFVERSKRYKKGRGIKIADVTDNSTPERLQGLPDDEKGILEERYVPALAFLKDDRATEFFTPRQLARLCKWCSKPFSDHTGVERKCPPGALLFSDPQRGKFKGVC